MSLSIRFLAFTFLFNLALCFGTARAAGVPLPHAVLTGTIYLNPAESSQRLVEQPLTKRALLDAFGYPEVPAAKARFYSQDGLITLGSLGGEITYGNVVAVQLSNDGVSGKNKFIYRYNGNFVNNAFAGSALFLSLPATMHEKVTFDGFGTLGSSNAIIRGSLSYDIPRR